MYWNDEPEAFDCINFTGSHWKCGTLLLYSCPSPSKNTRVVLLIYSGLTWVGCYLISLYTVALISLWAARVTPYIRACTYIPALSLCRWFWYIATIKTLSSYYSVLWDRCKASVLNLILLLFSEKLRDMYNKMILASTCRFKKKKFLCILLQLPQLNQFVKSWN